ncbi:MAG TPA: sigma-70 family RNA polymerase sigma factor [Cyclobacteriaceae bacterium]|nr:sigma-70 family RNA polymerase sigma factor [Cyclobacteriaceae bacterium]
MTQTQTIALYHPMLHSIALRIVKHKVDAEDIVQDTFLKWLSIDKEQIQNTKAYLIKSVTNNCLNHLQALKRKKVEYMDQIPEFITKFKELDLSQIDIHIDMQAALKMIHNKLEPLERAVFVLREVFNFDYEALQEVLEKKKDHCRQLFSRAKKKLEGESLKINFDWPTKPQWVENFSKACEMGFSSDLIKSLQIDAKPA